MNDIINFIFRLSRHIKYSTNNSSNNNNYYTNNSNNNLIQSATFLLD